ncbi:RpiB/LacA/LacB family sugar-phosphate isomerase [Candidatus Saccharibacteria bacterium]|nr:RpiB/LacA/LacB family sugar-phosphate isomerase [Candidatus Saccharibacteria bacterium]
MTIALAADHAGFEQLKELSLFLESLGHEVKNLGPKSLNPGDDYPDFIIPAAKAVAGGECQRGIVLGGSGQGEAMAANKLKGIRCAVFYGPAVAKKVVDADGRTSHNPYEIVRLSRQHDDTNMLSLAARFVTLEDMKQVVKLWLETPFSEKERHQRRIKKIDELGL